MEPMTKPTNIKDELAELRRNGDPRISAETKTAIRNLTQEDWDQHARVVDALTAGDFDDLDTES